MSARWVGGGAGTYLVSVHRRITWFLIGLITAGLATDALAAKKRSIDPAAHRLSSTYFVGESGILVHDNTPRKPARVIVPGLVATM